MPRNIHLWLTGGIVGLLVVFILQNVATVDLTLLFWTISLPRAILLAIVFAIGVLVGWILKTMRHPKRPE